MVSKLVYNLLVGLITYLYRGEITQLLSTGRTSQYPPQKRSHIPPFTGPTPGKSSTQKRRRFVGDMWCDRSQECIWHPKMLGSFQGPHSWIIEGQWWFITPQRRPSWETLNSHDHYGVPVPRIFAGQTQGISKRMIVFGRWIEQNPWV